MVFKKEPSKFKDEVTVEYLNSTWMDHQQIVEELALSEMHSLELPIPLFNTLASLNKADFNKFMLNLKQKFSDSKEFTIMVAGITDTLTCMIKNNSFYENYVNDNKRPLDILTKLLVTAQHIIRYNKDIDSKQLSVLIGILEKSAQRIQGDEKAHDFNERIMEVIKNLKVQMQNQIDKENKVDVDRTDDITKKVKKEKRHEKETKINNASTEDGVKENFKKASAPESKTKKAKTNNVKADLKNTKTVFTNNGKLVLKDDNIINNKYNKKLKLASSDVIKNDDENKAIANTVPLKSQAVKKPSNAFELMMKSSKLLTRKRKGTS